MASYTDLFEIVANNTLMQKVTAAVAVQVDVVRAEDGGTANHANRLLWAREAFGNPQAMAQRMIWAAVATNRSATKAQIEGASDAAILAAVAAVVDIFATGA